MWFNTPRRCSDWTLAIKHLRKADPVLCKIIDASSPCALHPRRDYFVVLCRSIFSQQISTKVAAVLFDRFRNLFPMRRPTPQKVIDLLTTGDPELVRSCGLSRQKQSYILDLAMHFASGEILTRRFARMTDEEIIDALTRVKGVGRWTAEMFLMFVLNRLDVLPVDDLGLRQGVQQVYGLRKVPTADRLRLLAKPWQPYRTVATWYIWRRPKDQT